LRKFKINSNKSTVYEVYFTLTSVDWIGQAVVRMNRQTTKH